MNENRTRANFDTDLTPPESRDVLMTEAGCIYFIRVADAVKIGFAGSFRKRLFTLQTAHEKQLNVLAVISAKHIYETDVHQRFAHLRIRGEWFRAEQELLDYIEAVKASFGEDEHELRVRAKPAPFPREMVQQLCAIRAKHGPHSLIGCRISNFLEMKFNHTHEPDRDARKRLMVNMAREIKAVEHLLQEAS